MRELFTEDVGATTVSRRSMVAGLLAFPVAGAARSEVDPFEEVRRCADALAASMAALHGEECRVCIDHVAKTAVVCALA